MKHPETVLDHKDRKKAWREGPSRLRLIGALSVICLVLPVCWAGSPSTIGVLAMVNAELMPIVRGWILADPSINGTIIPLREPTTGGVEVGFIERMMRIYYPKTFEALVSYDFMLLQGVDMAFLSPRQVQWMYDAIAVHGLGAANTRSAMSMHLYLAERWATSVLSEAFPNDAMAAIRNPGYAVEKWGKLVVNDDPTIPPVMRPFKRDIEAALPTYGGLLTIPKPGCRIHSWIKTDRPEYAYPLAGCIAHVFEWDYEEAVTFTLMDGTRDDPFLDANVNPFALDVVVNVIWHGSHRELLEDAVKVHVLRDRLWSFAQARSLAISVFDFAEIFGANTQSLYRELASLETKKSRADAMYLEEAFDQAYALMDEVMQGFSELTSKSIRLKDQTLIWVHMVEWLAVVGASVLCGASIWMLMVKRKLYVEAGVSRLSVQERRGMPK